MPSIITPASDRAPSGFGTAQARERSYGCFPARLLCELRGIEKQQAGKWWWYWASKRSGLWGADDGCGPDTPTRIVLVCPGKSDTDPPSTDSLFLNGMSFGLVLLSVEQSLRLLLLLDYSVVRDDTSHNSHVLYKDVRNKSGAKTGPRQNIINRMNELGQAEGITPCSETELVDCLRKHDPACSDSAWFQLCHQARLNKPVPGRDTFSWAPAREAPAAAKPCLFGGGAWLLKHCEYWESGLLFPPRQAPACCLQEAGDPAVPLVLAPPLERWFHRVPLPSSPLLPSVRLGRARHPPKTLFRPRCFRMRSPARTRESVDHWRERPSRILFKTIRRTRRGPARKGRPGGPWGLPRGCLVGRARGASRP